MLCILRVTNSHRDNFAGTLAVDKRMGNWLDFRYRYSLKVVSKEATQRSYYVISIEAFSESFITCKVKKKHLLNVSGILG